MGTSVTQFGHTTDLDDDKSAGHPIGEGDRAISATARGVKIKSADYLIDSDGLPLDDTILADTSEDNVTITLPPSSAIGRVVQVKNIRGGTNTLTLARNDMKIDDAEADLTTTTDGAGWMLQFGGDSGWWVIGKA